MSFQLKKINNEVVREVPLLKAVDNRPIKGSALFPELCANVFFCARKKSGKTSAIFKTIKRCAGSKTKVMVFCSTLHKDPSWEAIQFWCEQKGLPFIGYTSLMDDDGTNLLADLIKGLQEEEEEDEQKTVKNMLDSDDEEEPQKERQSKYQAPDWIFVLDDLADELRKPIVATFLKKNRHFRAKVIISSQY